MLPPLDPSVLQRNPNFDVLYKDLTTRKLNSDSSTRDTKKQRMHEEIRRTLTISRTKLLESQILLKTLTELPSKAEDLPPELHSIIELVTAQLSGQVTDADRDILSGDTALFLTHIPTVSSAISAQLTTVTDLLCSISDPDNPPDIDDLKERSEELRDAVMLRLPRELAEEKLRLANTAYAVLSLHREVLETSIRILEQTQHGSLARAMKSKAELLNAQATVLGLQARIHTHSHPPPAEFVAALKNFKSSQGTSEAKLRDREGLARRTLELYERAGEKAMRDLAKRKEFLVGEMRQIEEQIGTLESEK